MTHIPVYFDGEIGADELRSVLEAGGFHVRTLGGRLVCSRIPQFLRRDEPSTNVINLRARAK